MSKERNKVDTALDCIYLGLMLYPTAKRIYKAGKKAAIKAVDDFKHRPIKDGNGNKYIIDDSQDSLIIEYV